MGRANRLCLATLCLAATLSAAAAAQPTGQAGSTGAAESRSGEAQQNGTRVALSTQAARVGEQRRVSYASCNRESHKRDLRGGARRRFLIRCKLGLERRHGDRAKEPAAPGRRP